MGPGARELAIAAAAVALACGGPSPGRDEPAKRQILLETEAHDERVGRDAAADVRASLGLVEDAALVDYVQGIGRRLLLHAPRRGYEYSFQIVDQAAPNAFALPGGQIFVSRGLLALTNSEDELANVVGHEIIHVAARHAAAQQAAAARTLPGPFQFYAMADIRAYGRDQEREADRLGQGLSALSGYDPAGLATFLRNLEYTERLQLGRSRLPNFWDTHPATTERAASARERGERIQWPRTPEATGSPEAYLRRLEGLTVGPSAREGVVEGSRFLQPDMRFSMRFPDGWQVINTPAAVGAVSPRRDAQVFLEQQGLGRDPELSAREFLEHVGDQLRVDQVEPIRIGDLEAFRARGSASGAKIVLTWIAYESAIYRLTGAAASSRYEGAFLNVARSFRPLDDAQRASIREDHLRLEAARQGEGLAALSQRSGNRWDLQTTAIMNGIFANQALVQGQLVKVAVAVPYEPRR